MKRILICGGTGFIGRNLVEYFSKKNDVFVRATHFTRDAILEYKNVEWVRADLRDASQVKYLLKDVDIILQFAATTSGAKDILTKPYIHVTDNAIINSLIMREAFEQNIEHFIFPSCTIMYQNSENPIKESDFNPSDPINDIYFGAGHTKVYLEKMCEFYSKFSKTKFTVIRHSNIYGPYDKFELEKSHVFAASMTKIMNAQDNILNVWGTGNEKRDLLYISDLCDFINLSLLKQDTYFEIFNVGLGYAISIKELIDKMLFYCKINIEIKYDSNKPTIPTFVSLDCSKAKNVLKWSPKINLDEGIVKTLDWYKKWNKMDIN